MDGAPAEVCSPGRCFLAFVQVQFHIQVAVWHVVSQHVLLQLHGSSSLFMLSFVLCTDSSPQWVSPSHTWANTKTRVRTHWRLLPSTETPRQRRMEKMEMYPSSPMWSLPGGTASHAPHVRAPAESPEVNFLHITTHYSYQYWWQVYIKNSPWKHLIKNYLLRGKTVKS